MLVTVSIIKNPESLYASSAFEVNNYIFLALSMPFIIIIGLNPNMMREICQEALKAITIPHTKVDILVNCSPTIVVVKVFTCYASADNLDVKVPGLLSFISNQDPGILRIFL